MVVVDVGGDDDVDIANSPPVPQLVEMMFDEADGGVGFGVVQGLHENAVGEIGVVDEEGLAGVCADDIEVGAGDLVAPQEVFAELCHGRLVSEAHPRGRPDAVGDVLEEPVQAPIKLIQAG